MSLRIALAGALLAVRSGAVVVSSPSAPSPTPSGNQNCTPVSIVSGASTLTTTAFAPNPITVAAGGTVTWTNADNTAHTSTAANGNWNSGSIPPGGRFSHDVRVAGSFAYHCTIHPGMVGTVTVQ